MTEAVYVLGASIMAFAKYAVCIKNKAKIKCMIDDMQYMVNMEKTQQQMDFHVAAERKSEFINKIYIKLLGFSATVLLVTPAIALLIKYMIGTLSMNNLPLTFSYLHNLSIDTTQPTGYLFMYLVCIVYISSVVPILMTIDLYFLSSCVHIVAACLDLKDNLLRIDDDVFG